MADVEEYIELPEEDEQAFLQLEKKFRAEMNEELNEAEQRQVNNDTAYLSYINRTVAAAKTYTLEYFRIFEIPSHRANLWDAYQEFTTIVEHYKVQIKIVHGRRVRGYSVQLDPAAVAGGRCAMNDNAVTFSISLSPRSAGALAQVICP